MSPTPWPTQYVASCLAPESPACASLSIFASAGSETRLWSGIGSGSGASGDCHASVHAERSWRVYLPVRERERTVWRELAASIFSFTIGLVSASIVVSHTDPVHAPAAPIAMHAAI